MARIKISVTSKMYEDVKKAVKKQKYSSKSAFVREAVRKLIYPHLTENEFTK